MELNSEKCEKKHHLCVERIENSVTGGHCDHLASLMMPNGDPLDRFLYPTLTLMIDSFLALWIGTSEILPCVRKSYLTHTILPRLSHEG